MSDPLPHDLGLRIARLRKQNGLSQEAAADRAGCSLRAFQNWERGHAVPHPGNLRRVAEALGVSVGDLTQASTDRARPYDEGLLVSLLDRVRALEERVAELERWRSS